MEWKQSWMLLCRYCTTAQRFNGCILWTNCGAVELFGVTASGFRGSEDVSFQKKSTSDHDESERLCRLTVSPDYIRARLQVGVAAGLLLQRAVHLTSTVMTHNTCNVHFLTCVTAHTPCFTPGIHTLHCNYILHLLTVHGLLLTVS